MPMIKNCEFCGGQFQIDESDLEFYKKMDVPPPSLCPQCRFQRRLAVRNERFLYQRQCDLCNKKIISVYPAGSKYKIYCHECWWSDKWDPFGYGREYDFNKPFFEQFSELEKSIPHFALFHDGTSENCDYINYGYQNKSCYLAYSCAWSEDVYHSSCVIKSKSCVDCFRAFNCELCYECAHSTNCYNLKFSHDCSGCSDGAFLVNCNQCKNCFCSVGQRNKQYVFLNEQLSKEEFNKRLSEIKYTNEEIKKWREKLDSLALEQPFKYMHGNNCTDCSGDYLDNCQSVRESFECVDLKDCKFCFMTATQSHDLYDSAYAGAGSQLAYEVHGCTGYNNCKAIYFGRALTDCSYCQYCFSSADLFGCIGLRHKEFCVFNKQYPKIEYQKIVKEIKNKMIEDNEYGEFFPIKFSSFAYNETAAMDFFPVSQKEAFKNGWKWLADDKKEQQKSIEALQCVKCKKNYRPIKQELDFYKQMNLPIPQKCPYCRYKEKLELNNPYRLWKRNCQKCHNQIVTSYCPESSEIVYCEKCYLQSVY